MPWWERDVFTITGTITEFSSFSRQITFNNRHTFVFPGDREVEHFLTWMMVSKDSDVIGQTITLHYSKHDEITDFS